MKVEKCHGCGEGKEKTYYGKWVEVEVKKYPKGEEPYIFKGPVKRFFCKKCY